ncbi:MAG: cupin domain-containing protein [Candidatus Moranbacteria bacterium]|nr:cupin domain-containing protein [Candidatus Moranbacteria bacterium]
MKIIKRENLEMIKGTCGDIWEMGGADNMDVAFVNITNKFRPHLHKRTEEIYYILRGRGIVTIDKEQQEVQKGDLIPISKNKLHTIEKISEKPLELLAITTPKYDPEDVIEK